MHSARTSTRHYMNSLRTFTAFAIFLFVFSCTVIIGINAGMSPAAQHKDLHEQLWQDGLKVRREVIGDEYVERSLKNATDYTQPMQELVTEWVWGNIWTRPGLDRKQRSFLGKFSPLARTAAQDLRRTHAFAVIGISIAQQQWHELSLHTRGAINNGLSETEIREAVLTATVYCGVPAGLEAIKVTETTINQMVDAGEYRRP